MKPHLASNIHTPNHFNSSTIPLCSKHTLFCKLDLHNSVTSDVIPTDASLYGSLNHNRSSSLDHDTPFVSKKNMKPSCERCNSYYSHKHSLPKEVKPSFGISTTSHLVHTQPTHNNTYATYQSTSSEGLVVCLSCTESMKGFIDKTKSEKSCECCQGTLKLADLVPTQLKIPENVLENQQNYTQQQRGQPTGTEQSQNTPNKQHRDDGYFKIAMLGDVSS